MDVVKPTVLTGQIDHATKSNQHGCPDAYKCVWLRICRSVCPLSFEERLAYSRLLWGLPWERGQSRRDLAAETGIGRVAVASAVECLKRVNLAEEEGGRLHALKPSQDQMAWFVPRRKAKGEWYDLLAYLLLPVPSPACRLTLNQSALFWQIRELADEEGKAPGQSALGLARMLGLSHSTAQRAIKRMRELKVIEAVRHEGQKARTDITLLSPPEGMWAWWEPAKSKAAAPLAPKVHLVDAPVIQEIEADGLEVQPSKREPKPNHERKSNNLPEREQTDAPAWILEQAAEWMESFTGYTVPRELRGELRRMIERILAGEAETHSWGIMEWGELFAWCRDTNEEHGEHSHPGFLMRDRLKSILARLDEIELEQARERERNAEREAKLDTAIVPFADLGAVKYLICPVCGRKNLPNGFPLRDLSPQQEAVLAAVKARMKPNEHAEAEIQRLTCCNKATVEFVKATVTAPDGVKAFWVSVLVPLKPEAPAVDIVQEVHTQGGNDGVRLDDAVGTLRGAAAESRAEASSPVAG